MTMRTRPGRPERGYRLQKEVNKDEEQNYRRTESSRNMRTRPGVCSSAPNASGDDVIASPSGTERLTTIFKMADFDLP